MARGECVAARNPLYSRQSGGGGGSKKQHLDNTIPHPESISYRFIWNL